MRPVRVHHQSVQLMYGAERCAVHIMYGACSFEHSEDKCHFSRSACRSSCDVGTGLHSCCFHLTQVATSAA